MERTKPDSGSPSKTFEWVFRNAMGNPVIFDVAPSADEIKANTWGKVKDATDFIYMKFADDIAIKIPIQPI